MRAIRIKDTILYFIASAIGFCIAFGLSYPAVSLFVYPVLLLYILFDTYFLEGCIDVYRASRMQVLLAWCIRSAVYLLLIQLIFTPAPFQSLYVFSVQYVYFFLTPLAFKFFFLTWTANRLKKNKVWYHTIILGQDSKASNLVSGNKPIGQKIIGSLGDNPVGSIPYLGKIESLSQVISEYNIEEIIIALENEETDLLKEILTLLRSSFTRVLVKITPDTYDFLLGHIKLDALYSAPLIELPSGQMKKWQILLKRTMDIIVSLIVLLILMPVIIWIAVKTKFSSRGNIFYSQERIGKNGVPFQIYKFRSMHENAEKGLPQLSFEGDDRCTPWGTFMRKWRLDEIPQFWNVLKGDMSVVGPRPEREYFINQIKLKASFYPRILTVLPGITSWGQVKYGYASTVNQMIERLKFDLIYVENQSLSLDIKIILYTILVLFQGKGK